MSAAAAPGRTQEISDAAYSQALSFEKKGASRLPHAAAASGRTQEISDAAYSQALNFEKKRGVETSACCRGFRNGHGRWQGGWISR